MFQGIDRPIDSETLTIVAVKVKQDNNNSIYGATECTTDRLKAMISNKLCSNGISLSNQNRGMGNAEYWTNIR
jgi:hypothetical protein